MRKGLPSQYAKMGFKKGWKAYKAAHGRISGHKKTRTTKRHHSGGYRGPGRVHHAVMLDGDFSSPAIVQRPVKKLSAITPGKILSPIIDLGLLIVGMAIGAGIKKASPIKNPHLMNGTAAVAGVGGSLFTKNRFVKMPLLGVALQSTISEAKLLFPKMVPIAGDDEVVYLPMNEDDPSMIEFQGDDDRINGVIDGEDGYGVPAEIEMQGDDDRVSGVIDGEDYEEMSGEEGHDS